MAITWGSYSGYHRVGIDYVISPAAPAHEDTSVQLTWKIYIGSNRPGGSYSDMQTIDYQSTGQAADSHNYQYLGPSTRLVHEASYSYAITYSTSNKTLIVDAYNCYDGGEPSGQRTVTLPARPVLVPSADTNPVASAITSNSATLDWSVPGDNGGAAVTLYEYQVSKSASFSPTTHAGTQTGRTKALTGLLPATVYYYRIRSQNSAGWSAWDSGTPFTTASALPSVPALLAVSIRATTSLTYGWAASSENGGGAVTYTIDLAENSGFTTGVQTYSGVTSVSQTFTGLTQDTTYYARVKATNSVGTSAYSSTVIEDTLVQGTYDDEGPLTTLINNLATAVADKLVRLGTFATAYTATAPAIANSTVVNLAMTTRPTAGSERGPDAPTVQTGSGTDNVVINYPGTYEIEFGFHWDHADTAGRGQQRIYVNGNHNIRTADGKYGANAYIDLKQGTSVGDSIDVIKCTRQLEEGDTIGFGVYQTTGASFTSATGEPVALYFRVTMVGF